MMRYAAIPALALMGLIVHSASAFDADYQKRLFQKAQWFIYDGPQKYGFAITTLSEPKCHEIGEVLIFLNSRKQAIDETLLQATAEKGFKAYRDYCDGRGERASGTRKVIAILGSDVETNERGQAASENILVTGEIRLRDGTAHFQSQRNYVQQALDREAQETELARQRAERQQVAEASRAARDAERAVNEAQRQAMIASVREQYEPILTASLEQANDTGFFSNLFGSDSTKLSGAWSGSQAQCKQEILILINKDETGRVEWWKIQGDYGILPWRTGSWELRGGTLIMTLNHMLERSIIDGELIDKDINQTIQLDVVDVSDDDLRLTVPGSLSDSLAVLGSAEKVFVRCRE